MRIAAIPGDGIGPEICGATLNVLRAAGLGPAGWWQIASDKRVLAELELSFGTALIAALVVSLVLARRAHVGIDQQGAQAQLSHGRSGGRPGRAATGDEHVHFHQGSLPPRPFFRAFL